MGLWKFCSVCFCLRSGGENKTMRVSAIAFEGFLTVGRRNKMVDVLEVQTLAELFCLLWELFFFRFGTGKSKFKNVRGEAYQLYYFWVLIKRLAFVVFFFLGKLERKELVAGDFLGFRGSVQRKERLEPNLGILWRLQRRGFVKIYRVK